jgi:hypothetical protein
MSMGNMQRFRECYELCNFFRTRVHSYCTSKVARDNQKMQKPVSVTQFRYVIP